MMGCDSSECPPWCTLCSNVHEEKPQRLHGDIQTPIIDPVQPVEWRRS